MIKLSWKSLLAFLQLTRPLFLAGGLILHALGAVIALVDGYPFHPGRFLLGQLLITSVQLMTHYANEYYDQEGDRINANRTWFSGGSGVLARGSLTPQTVRLAALIFAAIAMVILIIIGSRLAVIFVLGGTGLAAAWSYSGPPLFLVNTGWGELVASLIVPGMVPLIGYVMQSGGTVGWNVMAAVIPLGLLHFSMLVAFEVPDRQADEAVGKRTLVVRQGYRRAMFLHNFSLFLAFCVILGLFPLGWPGAKFVWLLLPLAIWQAVRFHRFTGQERTRFLWLTMRAILLFALAAFLMLAGYLFTWFRG